MVQFGAGKNELHFGTSHRNMGKRIWCWQEMFKIANCLFVKAFGIVEV